MKVFLSWSGKSSGELAIALQEWLESIFAKELADFWSSAHAPKGIPWRQQLEQQLESTHFGILCMVPSNISAPWVLFEAGALSKVVKDSFVVPYCLGLTPKDLGEPLSGFQGASADKEGTHDLIRSINRALPIGEKTDRELQELFNEKWPILEQKLKVISRAASFDIADVRLGDFIDRTQREAYLTDKNLIVTHCSDAFLQFLGANRGQVIGKHVKEVIALFSKLVPPSRRRSYRKRQVDVLVSGIKAPYARISEAVDMRQRPAHWSEPRRVCRRLFGLSHTAMAG